MGVISKFTGKVHSFATRMENSKSSSFERQLKSYRELDKKPRFSINQQDMLPVLYEATEETNFDAHYIYHPAWAARIVKQINPAKHIDISSTLHFCTQLSAFVPTEFYDYRPAKLKLDNLQSGRADLTKLFFKDNSIESLSCMHTIEHVGLGRYGDEMDPDGDIKAINELKRVVKPGGSLLLVSPVGLPRIQFNAHRIYSFEMIHEHFKDFELKNFSLVMDDKSFLTDPETAIVNKQRYGCGCFWYIKK